MVYKNRACEQECTTFLLPGNLPVLERMPGYISTRPVDGFWICVAILADGVRARDSFFSRFGLQPWLSPYTLFDG